MFPGMNKKAVEQAMKKMGVKQEEIEASEVIIKTSGKDLVIKNPNVMKVHMMGEESFQISGEVVEGGGISEEDVRTVAEQAEVLEEEARKALEETDGDLAEAILKLKKE